MDKENIMMIKFEHCGAQMLAMFNQNIITEDKVRLAIQLYDMIYNNNVLIMTKEQYRSVFFGEK